MEKFGDKRECSCKELFFTKTYETKLGDVKVCLEEGGICLHILSNVTPHSILTLKF